MDRRPAVALLLAAVALTMVAVPGLPPPAAAASCSGWTSELEPPTTIRVFRHLSGEVETVDFRAYTKNVLSREWIGSWTTEALRSGALAVKHYAWYQVLHWRGGTNADGTCFDVRDDTYDQVYDPARATWASAASAVDATWAARVLKNGRIFPTYYNAGAVGEPCGANANGWRAYQWGTQACGLVGMTAAQIVVEYYYPGVTVADAPPSAPTPNPTPTATPVATPTASSTPAPTAAPSATPGGATPVPTPVPTPLPTPPPAQEQPGGGQTGLAGAATPPPPPPDDPVPIVAAGTVDAFAEPALRPNGRAPFVAYPRLLAWAVADNAAGTRLPAEARPSVQLVAFRLLWDAAVRSLVAELSAALAGPAPGDGLARIATR